MRQAELWFATTPAPGVWADLLLVLDNPLAEPAERTVLRFPATLLEDFALRDTEPPLLGPPVREADGRYAFVFPAPLDRSLNWYRVFLAARRQAPRPFQVAVSIDAPPARRRAQAPAPALSPLAPRTRYVDRAADPFRAVPEALVAWLPSRPAVLLPLLALTGGRSGYHRHRRLPGGVLAPEALTRYTPRHAACTDRTVAGERREYPERRRQRRGRRE